MFFDALGIKWWYEPEGFSLRFDYEDFVADWDADEEELLEEGVPQTFAHLDGKEYSYLPDFYLPELHYWVEIKGPNPTREEVEKAFMLSHMVSNATEARIAEAIEAAKAEGEVLSAINDFDQQGVYIIYGDIPWPFPQKGDVFGFGAHDSGSMFFAHDAGSETLATKHEYRSLLMGQLHLCWQECPLCLKIGVGRLGAPYCRRCYDQPARHIRGHLARYSIVNEAGIQDTSDPAIRDITSDPAIRDMVSRAGMEDPNPKTAKAFEGLTSYIKDMKALDLTKSLINPEFFASGHKSPRLQAAYTAARSARFEHGQSP